MTRVGAVGAKPAYGRDYKSQKAVREAWNADLDFEVTDFANAGRKVNKSDAQALGLTVTIRYDRLTKQVQV